MSIIACFSLGDYSVLDPHTLVLWGIKLQEVPNALYSVLRHASEIERFGLE